MSNSLRDSEQPWLAMEDELMRELYRQMLRVVRHKLRHKHDAGDVVQEAWIRILENFDSLKEKKKLIPWAKTIAWNLASNANRARKTEWITDEAEAWEKEARTYAEPEVLLELSDLLGRMDPTTRTLLLYKFYYGFKDNEIAAALQMPVGTVKAKIHRSKARLLAQNNDQRPNT